MTLDERKRLLPTAEELQLAHDQISADGPAAPFTIELGKLAVANPTLKGIVQRILGSKVAALSIEEVIGRGALNGALLAGLNLGLRIGEIRRQRNGGKG